MRTHDRAAARRSIAVGGVLVIGAAVAFPALAQEDIRTETPQLGGYTAEAVSSPISVLLFEPTIPVPAGPGEPHGEMHGSYSKATLGTGPAARGLGSSTWPGPTAGDGLSAFDENIPPYPFKASATYPDGPFENRTGDENTGAGMYAIAKGVDVLGYSDGAGELIPGAVTVGNVSTTSTTTVTEDGVVEAVTIATFSELALVGGLVTIEGMETRLIARSNGVEASTDGAYEVSGMKVLGQDVEFTEDGAVIQPEGEDPITIPLGLGNEIDLSDAIGIKVEAAPVVEEVDGPTAKRSTRGVMITIDSSNLRQAVGFLPLADVITAIPDNQFPDVVPCDDIPEQMSAIPCFKNPVTGLKANLFTVAAMQPETRYLLGGGSVSATASVPFSFTPPPLPPPAPPSTSGGTTTTSISTPTFSVPPVQAAPPVTASQPAPVVAQASSPQTQIVALQVPEGVSGGALTGVAALGLAGAALMARGGRRLTMAAIYGAAGAPATVGAAAVPDLRAFAGKGARP